MSGDTTKEKILTVSLRLFSQRGFSAVSIRDICREVEIKESSVYYYFKNKRAILDALQAEFEATAARLMRQLNQAVDAPCASDAFSGGYVSEIFFKEYLMDNFCNRFMCLLQIEQNHNDKMRKVYDQWLFQAPLEFQGRIFSLLMEQGLIPAADSSYLAVKYYAPIFLYLQRYLLSGEMTEEKKALFCQEAGGHTACFFAEMGVK